MTMHVLYSESRHQVQIKAYHVPALEACSQNRGHWYMKALHVLDVKPRHRIGDIFLDPSVSSQVIASKQDKVCCCRTY